MTITQIEKHLIDSKSIYERLLNHGSQNILNPNIFSTCTKHGGAFLLREL